MIRHAIKVAATLALGASLAAAAHAQATYGQSNAPAANMPSASPSAAMPNASSGANPNAAAPDQMQQAATPQRLSRDDIKGVQEQLKSAGLYRGQVDGIMGPKMRQAVARFQQQNGLPRTARLDQDTLDRLSGSQTSGVGSSSPASVPAPNSNAMSPPSTNPAINGAGGGIGATDRNTGSQNPSNPNLTR